MEREMIEMFKREIQLLTEHAKSDPKSYQIWFHRLWTLQQLRAIGQRSGNLGAFNKFADKDLAITELFISKDERNFHAWNYRMELIQSKA